MKWSAIVFFSFAAALGNLIYVGADANAATSPVVHSNHHECFYKTVIRYQWKTVVTYQKVVRYKPCGTPYYVWKKVCKRVLVPVKHRIRVCH